MPDAPRPQKKKRKLYKRIADSAWGMRVLCGLGGAYIRLCYYTSRWRVVGGEVPAQYWDQGKPFILAFWHGRLLMMPYCWRRSVPLYMLISGHRDGRLITGIVGQYGIHTTVGSSSSGGMRGFRELLRMLKNGACVGITPDGPRGPMMQVQDGIIQAARLSGTPILPVSCSVSRRRMLNSWDRFVVALPFARGVIAWGEPIHVDRNADDAAQETARQQVADALNRLTAQADQACGHTPLVAPAQKPQA